MSKVVINAPRPNTLRKGENENEYYNVVITKDYNPPNQDLLEPIVFSTTRTSPVLVDPSQYELSVVRFSIPSNIPIFVWDDVGPSLKISFEFGGVTYTQPLTYQSWCNICLPENSVYYYQQLINIINTALEQAFWTDYPTNTIRRFPLAPPTEPPYMTYDPTTKLCSLYAQQSYRTSGLPVPIPDTIKIFFSATLHTKFFVSLPIVDTPTIGGEIYTQMRIEDLKNNTPTAPLNYYEMKQEYTTLALWSDLQSILLETNSIPVEPEFEPTENDTTRRIITDFEPSIEINDRQAFQYQPQGALRWYDLRSNYPLRSLDVRILWKSKTGTTYPLYIQNGETASIKLRFRLAHPKYED
jgi:hypothetical protein